MPALIFPWPVFSVLGWCEDTIESCIFWLLGLVSQSFAVLSLIWKVFYSFCHCPENHLKQPLKCIASLTIADECYVDFFLRPRLFSDSSWPWLTLMDPDWPWALRVYLFLPLSLFNLHLHWLDPPWLTMSAVCCEDFFPFYILTLTDPSWPWLTLTLTDDGHFAHCWFLSFLLSWLCPTDPG